MKKPLFNADEKITDHADIDAKHRALTYNLSKAVDSCNEPAFIQAVESLLRFYLDILNCEKSERSRRVFWIRTQWKDLPLDKTLATIQRELHDHFAFMVSVSAKELNEIFGRLAGKALPKSIPPAFQFKPLPGRRLSPLVNPSPLFGNAPGEFLLRLRGKYVFNSGTNRTETIEQWERIKRG